MSLVNVGTVAFPDWSPLMGAGMQYAFPGQVWPTNPGPIEAPLEVPAQSILIGIFVFGQMGGGTVTFNALSFDPVVPVFLKSPLATATLSGTGYKSAFLNASNYFVPEDARLVLEAIGANSTNTVGGAIYGSIPPNPGFNAISPARVYDSRLTGGPIGTGQVRTISVATSTGGAPVVPPGASAVVYNLTVADTVGTGFLGLFPAGATWQGNSSINWFTPNELDANGGIVALGGDRQINVICGGGGSTDFIVDVTGYFL